VGQRALDLPLGQEHVEVSVLHVLSHHAQRVGGHAHAQQPDDVGVVQTRHDLYLLQEVVSNGRTGGESGGVSSVTVDFPHKSYLVSLMPCIHGQSQLKMWMMPTLQKSFEQNKRE